MIRLESVLKASLQDVLKTSSKRLEGVLKMSWSLEDVLKTFWRRLENVLKMFLQDVLKKSWRSFDDALARRLEDVLKTFLQDVLKTFWRHFVRRLEDVLKTYDQDEYIGLDQDVLKTYEYSKYVRLDQDVLKTKTKGVFMTSSRRLQQDECLLGYYHKRKYQLFMLIFWETASYLKVTGLSCYSYGVCIVCGSATIFELRFGKTG